MTPDQLRALADALRKMRWHLMSIDDACDLEHAADYLLACADEQPVVWVDNIARPQPHAVTKLTYRSAHDARYGIEYVPLYLHPAPAAPQAEPKREPLSDDEISKLAWKQNVWTDGMIEFSILAFAREIENAHGIGGSDE